MIKDLLEEQEAIVTEALFIFTESVKLGDDLTADLLIQRIRSHERTALMLKGFLVN